MYYLSTMFITIHKMMTLINLMKPWTCWQQIWGLNAPSSVKHFFWLHLKENKIANSKLLDRLVFLTCRINGKLSLLWWAFQQLHTPYANHHNSCYSGVILSCVVKFQLCRVACCWSWSEFIYITNATTNKPWDAQ